MSKIALVAACCLIAAGVQAKGSGGSHAVKAYVKKDGTYVAPTRATNPNKTQRDNFSSKGNVNPATGKEGTKAPKR
jgi:hypothetical protein